MISVAITGGIACGKSAVGALVCGTGVPVLDTDPLAHELMAPGTDGYRRIRSLFGASVIGEDGHIDRRKLGHIVFQDDQKRMQLNAIVHPGVKAGVSRWLEVQQQQGQKIAAVIVPLLFEAGMAEGWDVIVCVGCKPEIQLARLMARGFNKHDARARMNAQMPLEMKVKRSNFVIWNDGSMECLTEEVSQVLSRIEEKK